MWIYSRRISYEQNLVRLYNETKDVVDYKEIIKKISEAKIQTDEYRNLCSLPYPDEWDKLSIDDEGRCLTWRSSGRGGGLHLSYVIAAGYPDITIDIIHDIHAVGDSLVRSCLELNDLSEEVELWMKLQ